MHEGIYKVETIYRTKEAARDSELKRRFNRAIRVMSGEWPDLETFTRKLHQFWFGVELVSMIPERTERPQQVEYRVLAESGEQLAYVILCLCSTSNIALPSTPAQTATDA